MITWKLPGQSRYDTGARKTVLAMAERICDVYGVSLDMDAIGSRPGRFFRQDCGKHPEPQQWRGGAYLDFADDYYCSDRDCDPENAARTPRAAGSHLHRRPPRAERILFRRTGLPAAPSPATSPAAPSRAVDLVIPAHAPAAALVGLAPVLGLAVPVRVPRAALAECPAGSVPAAAHAADCP